MREINLAKNISKLRKMKKITQEQLAEALNVSPQAVSKWETASCQPEAMTLPSIADYFNVSIDYLFYGEDIVYDDIYEKITDKVSSQQVWTEAPYDDALKITSSAVHGILKGKLNEKGIEFINEDSPVHISDRNGIAVSSPLGFSTIVSCGFMNRINNDTLKLAKNLLAVLSNEDCLRITAEIIRFSDISYYELKEKTLFDDNRLMNALEHCVKSGFIEEKVSRHKSIGKTYTICGHYYCCICSIFAAAEMIKTSLAGIRCWINWGDFPLSI